jgi:hypothetical protein
VLPDIGISFGVLLVIVETFPPLLIRLLFGPTMFEKSTRGGWLSFMIPVRACCNYWVYSTCPFWSDSVSSGNDNNIKMMIFQSHWYFVFRLTKLKGVQNEYYPVEKINEPFRKVLRLFGVRDREMPASVTIRKVKIVPQDSHGCCYSRIIGIARRWHRS